MVDTLLAAVGIVVKEPWADDISYEMLNYTLWKVQNGGDGCGYIALKDNIGVRPDSDQTVWRKAVEAGQSIYDLAVKYGHFDGTEEEFEAQYQAVLQAARNAASAASATNEEIQSAERLRVTAEQNRVSAETSRVSAEESRASAELTRENDEQARRNNESGRSVAEESRATAEQNRVSAENSRVSAENNRANAEVDRRNTFEALEEDMRTAIGQADAATADASAINAQIVSAENDRVAAESGRVTAEGNRVTAEQERVTAETGRATAETSRVTAEQSRASAETSRATAETNRETRANTDHNTATSDHETAASDHNTAASDHTQAGSDHERAESDHSRAEEDHASIADKVSQEELAVAIDPLARKDGSYDTMSVGLAKNLEGRTNVTDSFFERTAGGDAEVANGLAQMTEVGGNSVKFNQLVQNGNFANGTTGWSVAGSASIDSVSNGVVSVTFSNSSARFSTNLPTLIVGHKYLLGADITAYTERTVRIEVSAGWAKIQKNGIELGVETRLSKILEILSSSAIVPPILQISYPAMTADSALMKVSNVTLIDLTAIFGTDAEIAAALGITTAEITTDAGVAAFEAWLASNIGKQAYYPYNPGSVLNVNMAGIETVGRNLLDPTTGKARIIGAYSDVYGNYYGITGTHGAITFTSDMGETSTITPDEDGKFLLEEPGELSVADAGADCCVFLWWDGTQTDYAEHKDEKTYLDVTHIYGKLNGTGDLVRVWPTGMPKVNDLKDTLRIEDGQVVARRVLGEEDLGTLTYQYSTFQRFYASIPSPKHPASQTTKANAVSDQYIVDTFNQTQYTTFGVDRVFGIGPVGYDEVYIVDSRYSDPADFKTAVSGQKLYYELATPQVYTDLVYQGSSYFDDGTPVTLPLNYNADNWGIERVLPINTSETLATAKPELTCKYSIDAVETLNTHADEIEDLYDKNEELDAKKPNKTGDYPGMAVGSAKVLEGTDNKVEDFVFTASQCADGIAKLNEVRGKSLVWNQLAGVMDSYNSSYVSVSSSGNKKVFTITQAATSVRYITILNIGGYDTIVGHKYLLLPQFSITYDNKFTAPCIRYRFNGSWNSCAVDGERNLPVILTCTESETLPANAIAIMNGSVGDTITLYNDVVAMFIDLTLMFGAGNEPTTVEEFEALYPLPYYDYNPGEIISNKTEAVEVTGRNQWDEEMLFDKGLSNSGAVVSVTGYQVIDKVPIIPGMTYYFKTSKPCSYACFYDADGNLVVASGSAGIKPVADATFVAPEGCYFLSLQFSNYGSTYNHDICINLSDPSFNGQYEPYKKNTVTLNLPTLTGKLNGEGESVVVFPDGMRGAGTAYDKAAGNRAEVVMAEVDLGDLTWTGNANNRYVADLIDIRNYIGSEKANMICSAFPVYSANDVYLKRHENIIAATGTQLWLYAPSYTDAATLKSAMSGVLLYYELAEPLVYELDEGVPETFQAYKGGTLKQLPENGSEPTTAPCVMSVTYALDAVGILTGLPQNYVSKESLQAMLTAMQSAGLFASYTMTYNATTGKYEFTFTANS